MFEFAFSFSPGQYCYTKIYKPGVSICFKNTSLYQLLFLPTNNDAGDFCLHRKSESFMMSFIFFVQR